MDLDPIYLRDMNTVKLLGLIQEIGIAVRTKESQCRRAVNGAACHQELKKLNEHLANVQAVYDNRNTQITMERMRAQEARERGQNALEAARQERIRLGQTIVKKK